MHDPVKTPAHYTSHPSGVECIQITAHMNFPLGSAVKYLWRVDLKQGVDGDEDLRKAIQFIDFELQRRAMMRERHEAVWAEVDALFADPEPETAGGPNPDYRAPTQVSTVITPSLGGEHLEEHDYVGPLIEVAPGEYESAWNLPEYAGYHWAKREAGDLDLVRDDVMMEVE